MRTLAPIIAVLSAVLVSCEHQPVDVTVDTSDFPHAISVINSNNCLGNNCHTGSYALDDSLDLNSWETAMRGSKFEYDIIPFSAAKSHFFEHINTNSFLAAVATPRMPLGRDALSVADQKTIFDWINQGAPSARGDIAYSNVAHKVLVVNEGEDMVTVLDDSVRRIVRMTLVNSSSTPLEPSCIAMMPDKQSFLLGAVNSKGAVRKYAVGDLSVSGEFSSNYYINDLAVTPTGTKGYITDYPPSLVQRFGVFDPVSMKMGRSVSHPGFIGPYGIAITHDGRYAYISGSMSDNIAKVDTQNDSIVALFALASDVPSPLPSDYQPKYNPGFLTISADDSRLYVSCGNSAEIATVSLAADSVVSRTTVEYFPYRSALSSDGTELWVAMWGTNSIAIINTSSLAVTATIDSINTNPRSIAFSRDGTMAYVACEKLVGGIHNHGLNGGAPPSGIYVVDTRTKKIVYSFAAPGYSTQITSNY